MSTPAQPRKSPCASCPYRRSSPSGIWDASEYQKLPTYDGDTSEQATAAFFCHQGDNTVCAGWLGHTDPTHLLAVRLGVIAGTLDPACFDYRTAAELFASGEAAAAHGLRDITRPNARARDAIDRISRKRDL